MTKDIHHKLFFPHSPEVVWDYLTKPELMAQWLMKNDFQPIIGLDFQFKTNPIEKLNFDGIFYCKVLELVPFKKLSYSWKSGPGNGEITVDSIVVWTLRQTNGGTELQLVHSGFKEPENAAMYAGLNDGWLKNMHKISDRINAATHGTANA